MDRPKTWAYGGGSHAAMLHAGSVPRDLQNRLQEDIGTSGWRDTPVQWRCVTDWSVFKNNARRTTSAAGTAAASPLPPCDVLGAEASPSREQECRLWRARRLALRSGSFKCPVLLCVRRGTSAFPDGRSKSSLDRSVVFTGTLTGGCRTGLPSLGETTSPTASRPSDRR